MNRRIDSPHNDCRRRRRLRFERCEDRIVLSGTTAAYLNLTTSPGGYIALDVGESSVTFTTNFVSGNGDAFRWNNDGSIRVSNGGGRTVGSPLIFSDNDGLINVSPNHVLSDGIGENLSGGDSRGGSSHDLPQVPPFHQTSSHGPYEEGLTEGAEARIFEASLGPHPDAFGSVALLAAEFDPIASQASVWSSIAHGSKIQHGNSAPFQSPLSRAARSPHASFCGIVKSADNFPMAVIPLKSYEYSSQMTGAEASAFESSKNHGGAVNILVAVTQTQQAVKDSLPHALPESQHRPGGHQAVRAGEAPSEMARSAAFDLAGDAGVLGARTGQVALLSHEEVSHVATASATILQSTSAARVGDENDRELVFASWPVVLAATGAALLFEGCRRGRQDDRASVQLPSSRKL